MTELIITGKILGEGKFGVVKEGFLQGIPIACKEIAFSDSDDEKIFMNEIKIQHNLKHENIVKFLDWYIEKNSYGIMILELMCLNLYELMYVQNIFWDELTQTRIIKEVAAGLAYLHGKNILHRDIKPENILLNGQHTAKISDFGFSAQTTDGKIFGKIKGTIPYMAPELLKAYLNKMDFTYSKKTDIYAFGITCTEIIRRREPYEYESFSNVELLIDISNGLRDTLPVDAPPILAEITTNCVQQNPSDRKKINLIAKTLSIHYKQALIQSKNNKEHEKVDSPNQQQLPLNDRGTKLFSGKAHFWNNQNEKQLRSNVVCNHTHTDWEITPKLT
ncbi:MAG: protein kinase [Legionellaceae bacterium]|nr:protein kinase [Legionellaceae bacterium]